MIEVIDIKKILSKYYINDIDINENSLLKLFYSNNDMRLQICKGFFYQFHIIGIDIIIINNRLFIYKNSNKNIPDINIGDEIIKINNTAAIRYNMYFYDYPSYYIELKNNDGEIFTKNIVMPNLIFVKSQYNNDIFLENKDAIIYLPRFDRGYSKTIDQLICSNNLKKLTIDLRHNMGGKLYDMFSYLELFLDKEIKIRFYSKNKIYYKTVKNKNNNKFNINILLNKDTASSAELFSSILSNNNSNVSLIGNDTTGKNIVQMNFKQSDLVYTIPVLKYDINLEHINLTNEKRS